VQLADPDRHHFSVSCRLDTPAARQAFTLPSWIPGSYLLREFARFIVAIEATAAGQPIAIEQTAKGTWTVTDAAGPLVVTATVHGLDASIRGAWFDRTRAYFNGTALFLLAEGHAGEPAELLLERPVADFADDWRVATAMPAVAVDAAGFGRYRAADYDELIDHPFEIGRHAVVEFSAAGIPHRLVVTGRIDADLDRVAVDLSQLCTAQIDFFGRPPPFERYVFLGQAVGNGYGGLEHRASSSLIFRRACLPRPGDSGISREYQVLLGLVSHEYFHSWHVKRSRPAAFVPFRFDRRNHTRLLWVFEGITSYYQELFLVRSGLLGVEAFLRRLGELLTRVYRVPGRQRQSLAASSFNAWDQLYKPEANSVNQGVSYYSKGALVALALDLLLRTRTDVTLDDVVLALWQRYGSRDIGLPEDGFEALVAELAGAELRAALGDMVHGTDDPDLAALLADFGLSFGLRQAEGPKDSGGTPPTQPQPRLAFGASFEAVGPGLKLSAVLDGQPAQAAGLAPGDIIVALDRIQATADSVGERLSRYEAGDDVSVSFFRGDELQTTTLRLAPAPADTAFIALDPAAAPAALARRQAWLDG
jgi:predicted metalloprotease with PDZ domain